MSSSMIGLVMVLGVGQVGDYPPPQPLASMQIELPRGAVLILESLTPAAPPPTSPIVFPPPPAEFVPDRTVGSSRVELPPGTILTVYSRNFSPLVRPGTPMFMTLPGGGTVRVGPAMGSGTHPYDMTLFRPSRLVLMLPPEPAYAPPPTAYGPQHYSGPFRFRN